MRSHIGSRGKQSIPYKSVGTSGMKDAAPKGWIMRSHLSYGGKQNIPYKSVGTSSVKDVGPKEVDCEITPGEGNKAFLTRVREPRVWELLSRRI